MFKRKLPGKAPRDANVAKIIDNPAKNIAGDLLTRHPKSSVAIARRAAS
jgi:hypothetical protein